MCVCVCVFVSSCLLSASLPLVAYISVLRVCVCMRVFVWVHVLVSPVCMCLCVLLLKDLHSSVSPTSVKSCLVPVCHVTKPRQRLNTSLLYCAHCSPAIYQYDTICRPSFNYESKAKLINKSWGRILCSGCVTLFFNFMIIQIGLHVLIEHLFICCHPFFSI